YALAHAGIARVWLERQQASWITPREGGPKVAAAAEKALALDSGLAEVHYTLALCAPPILPQIFGGSPGTGFASGGSGSFVGGRNTVSRSFFTRPLPFSFSAIGFQQSAQMSYSRPSICLGEHSLDWPQRSQAIMLLPPIAS